MRKPILAANWKMNKTVGEASDFVTAFAPLVRDVTKAEIVVAPPFTALAPMGELLRGTNIRLAAQNIFYEDKGAFTGEVAAPMLTELGCSDVIIGHSERRQLFGETDVIVNRKIQAALRHGLNVIFCIGESLQERETGKTFVVLKHQINAGLSGIPTGRVVVAYEPIWAIGTGKTATPEQAQEAHRFIRGELAGLYGSLAQEIRVLYGGSVTPDNISVLMACDDVDGGLVGGASLKPDSFAKIVTFSGK